MTKLDDAAREEYFGHHRVTVIEPLGGALQVRFRELWAYRDLVKLFVRRDFVAQYKQTILGPAWHVIQPLITTLMFTIVFGRIAGISTDGVPPFLFYLPGTLLWSYFAAVTSDTSNTFIRNAGLFGKVYFPRLVVPISILLSKLIGFAIQLALLLVVLAWYSLSGSQLALNAWILATPLLILMLAALGLGIGITVSALTTRYRDLAVLVGFGLQLLMFASPIIYPLSAISEPWRTWASLNPIAQIVETFRHAFLGTGTVEPAMLGVSGALVLGLVLVGVALFNRIERTFMDTV